MKPPRIHATGCARRLRPCFARVAAGCVLVALAVLVSPRLAAAELVPLKDIVAKSHAVAYVRVVKVTEELQKETVLHFATLTLCGRASGLDDAREFDAHYSPPAKPDGNDAPPPEPVFVVAQRCIVLLARQNDRWHTVHRLCIAEDGKFFAEGVGEDIGLKPGIEADAVVQLLATKINPSLKKTRPKPPPTARNQPWNLMRSSPLRRVWPFFPR